MKTNRYILSLLLLVVSAFNLLTANAQQNQYAIYNYRNDGDFNAWLNIDVDSITYSCIDTLGVEHDEVVVQEVWTPDSVYRIPINAIDSLAFRAPKPVMREGLFYLREYHASHTVDIDSLTLYFDMGIRNDSLPAIGQVVLNGTYNSPYEEGFAGKVLSIKKEQGKIIIVCENAEIYDIFKKLIIVGKSSNDLDSISNAQRIRRKSVKIEETDVIENIKVPDLEMSVLDGIFKVKSKAPKVTCGYFVYVDELIYSISADAYIRHNDLSFEVAFKYSQMADAISDIKEHLLGQIESDYSRSTLEKYLKEGATIPLKKGVINISLKLAPQIKIDGDLELDFVTKTSAKQHIGFKAKGYTAAVIARLHNPIFSLIPFNALGSITNWDYSYVQNPAKSTSLSAKATGSAKAGFLVQLEANLIHKNVVHASVGVEAGRKLSGTLQFNIRDSENPDMNFYDIIKDTNVDLKSYAKIKGEIGASPIDFWTLKGEIDLYDDVLGKYYIVPHFTKPELPVYQNNSWNNYHPMSFYSTISKDILFTCKPGMRIVDEQGNIIKEVNTTDEYKYEVEWRYRPLEMDISDLEANKTYRCYPTFCFWGSTYFKAGPYKEFTVPHPISFETDKVSLQIGKSHKVAILGGWGDYSLGHLNKTACDAELKKEGDKYYVQLFGKAKGMAPITVNDLRSGKSKTLIVDVTEEEVTNLTLSENSVSLQKGDRATVTITSGSGNYTLANSDASVAVAAISNGNQIVIAALKAGTATITVTDTKTKQTVRLIVVVEEESGPTTPTKITMTTDKEIGDELVLFIGHEPGFIMSYWIDSNNNGKLDEDEIFENVDGRNGGWSGTSLIEVSIPIQSKTFSIYLKNVSYLECSYCDLTDLNLSNFNDNGYEVKLRLLVCDGNKLQSLMMSNHPQLKELVCRDNPQLGSVDLSGLPNLETLNAVLCGFETLNVRNNPKLTTLLCDGNRLESLELSNNRALACLGINYNDLGVDALNSIYRQVPDLSGQSENNDICWPLMFKMLRADGNPGYWDSDRSIAEAKGWEFEDKWVKYYEEAPVATEKMKSLSDGKRKKPVGASGAGRK